MEAELAALAASGATTLVGLMVSDAWKKAKGPVVRYFRRHRTGGEGTPDDEEQVLEGNGTEAEAEALRLRLARILEDDPSAAEELILLLAELRREHGVQSPPPPPAPPTPPADTLPDEVPPLRVRFVNRTADLSRMDRVVAVADDGGGDRVDVMVLGGTPGVGKTATARRWAHRSRERFPDGQIYVDFAELRGRPGGGGDVSAAVGMCLRSLGVTEDYLPSSLRDRVTLLRKRSAGRRMLFVLDDVSDPAQVSALVPQGAGSAVLVTSNATLGDLATDGAHLLALEPLDTDSALRILADRCGADAVAAEPAAAERLVALCGGLPVALHVVAARLLTARRLTMQRLADELADESGRLTAMSLRGERTVSAVFDSAYRQLPSEAARFYRLLGWLPCRTFDAAAAAAAADIELPAARPLLDALEDASLLEPVDDERYRFHDLVRLHARERAEADEPPYGRRAVVHRVATHYLALTAHADRSVRARRLRVAELDELLRTVPDPFARAGAPEPLAWLDGERANILAVLREASVLGLHTPVWQLAEAFTALFLNRRHLGDWRESLELGAAAAAAPEELVPAAEARLRSLLSRPLMDLGEYDRARTELERAVACAEITDRTDLRASVQEFLGRYWDRFDPARAIEVYRRSLELNTEAGESRGAAIATYFLGCAQDAAGDPARALTTLRQAHEALLADAEPDVRMAARATLAIGRAHDHLGETQQAVTALREGARILRQKGATHYEAQALLDLAAIAERPGGERTHLRDDLARALEVHEAGGSPLVEELRERLRSLDQES